MTTRIYLQDPRSEGPGGALQGTDVLPVEVNNLNHDTYKATVDEVVGYVNANAQLEGTDQVTSLDGQLTSIKSLKQGVIHVTPGATDVGATGSPILPFGTVTAAYLYGISLNVPFIVLCAPGTHTFGSLAIVPDGFIEGYGIGTTILHCTGGITIDESKWISTGPARNKGGFLNATLIFNTTSLVIDPNLYQYANLYFVNVDGIATTPLIQGFVDGVYFENSRFNYIDSVGSTTYLKNTSIFGKVLSSTRNPDTLDDIGNSYLESFGCDHADDINIESYSSFFANAVVVYPYFDNPATGVKLVGDNTTISIGTDTPTPTIDSGNPTINYLGVADNVVAGFTPTNYSPSNTRVKAHLQGIDTALAGLNLLKYNLLHVTPGASDVGATGSPLKPFGTVTAAYAAGVALNAPFAVYGAPGTHTFGDLAFVPSGYLVGAGKDATFFHCTGTLSLDNTKWISTSQPGDVSGIYNCTLKYDTGCNLIIDDPATYSVAKFNIINVYFNSEPSPIILQGLVNGCLLDSCEFSPPVQIIGCFLVKRSCYFYSSEDVLVSTRNPDTLADIIDVFVESYNCAYYAPLSIKSFGSYTAEGLVAAPFFVNAATTGSVKLTGNNTSVTIPIDMKTPTIEAGSPTVKYNSLEVVTLSSNTTLNSSHFLKRILCDSSTPFTVTFPQQSNLTTSPGLWLELENIGPYPITLAKQGAETLVGNTLLPSKATFKVLRGTTTTWNVSPFENTGIVDFKSGTSGDLLSNFSGDFVITTNNSAVALQVPLDSSKFFPDGTIFAFQQFGNGAVTLTPETGAVVIDLLGAQTPTSIGVGSVFFIKKKSPDHWVAWGDLRGAKVVGPSSSTNNAIVRYSGTNGSLIKNSAVTIDDSGNMDMGSHLISSVTDPVSAQDAATKAYVDNTVGFSTLALNGCSLASRPGESLNATYSNGSSGVGATLTNAGTQVAFSLDNGSPSVGYRVLIWQQTNAAHNGIYVVTNAGSGATNWVLTRATDFDTTSKIVRGCYTAINSGTINQGRVFGVDIPSPITVGTTDINFSFNSYSNIVTESGTSRTLSLSDFGRYIRTTSGSATTITIDTNANVPFLTGTEITIIQAGAGQVTIAAAGGVTINSKLGNLKTAAQYSAVTLKKVGTNTWDLIGDLVA